MSCSECRLKCIVVHADGTVETKPLLLGADYREGDKLFLPVAFGMVGDRKRDAEGIDLNASVRLFVEATSDGQRPAGWA